MVHFKGDHVMYFKILPDESIDKWIQENMIVKVHIESAHKQKEIKTAELIK